MHALSPRPVLKEPALKARPFMQNITPQPRLRQAWAFITRLNCKQAFSGWSDAEYRVVVDSKNEEALILVTGERRDSLPARILKIT